jgi:hypothetical protein
VKNDHEQIINRRQALQASVTTDRPSGNNNGKTANKKNSRPEAITRELSKRSPISSRKIEANRRNASKSTGPRTAIGKRMIAKNALKHGFFSKCLLIPHPDGKEDPTEYQDFRAALREHYQPLDFLEELWWRKSQSGPGVCADFYVVRAVKSPELWPSIVTRLSSHEQETR